MSRPDLIVPVRDRRRRKRILTLKNFGIFMAVCAVAFVAISIRSEMRGVTPGKYGRLFHREVPPPVAAKPMEVVTEAAVADETRADPTLVEPMARSQWLTEETTTPVPEKPVVAAAVRADGEVTIVGGADGVTVVRQERRRPVLSGGFGR